MLGSSIVFFSIIWWVTEITASALFLSITATIAFIPTEIVIKTLPNFKRTAIEKFFYINAKPLERDGLPNEFFKGIFDVDECKIL